MLKPAKGKQLNINYMRNLSDLISIAKRKYKPSDGFKPPLVFEEEKVVVSVEKGTHPNMKPMLQARLKSEGYRAYDTEGEELQLFEPNKIVWDGQQ